MLIHPTGVGRDVKAWNFVAGTEIDLSHPDGVGAIAVSRSSPMMVTAAGQTVRLWSLDEAKSQYEWKLPDNGSRAWSVVAISDDGRLAAAGGSGMTVQLYDAVSGTIQWTNLAQPLGAVVSLRFSEIGSSLSVTTTTGSSVYDVSGGNRSCDTPDATQVFKPTRMLSSDRQRDLFIRPDHSVLVRDIAGLYRKCKYYRPPSTFAVRDLRPGPNGWIGCVGLVDDKESFGFCEPSGEFMGPWRNQLMTIDQEGFYVTASRKTIVRWALPGSNRAQKPTELDVDDAEPYLSPGGRFVVGFHDRDSQRVLVWNVSTGSVVGEIRPFVTTQAKLEVMTLRAFVSPEGDRLITVAPMEPDRPQTPLPELLLWDVQAKKVLKSLGQSTENSRVTFSDNGRRVLVYSPYPADDPIRAFRLTDGRQVGPDLNAGPIVFAAISPDGLTIFTSGADNTGRVWDVATGSQICAFDSASLMLHASFRDDGALVTASMDRTACLRDTTNGLLLSPPINHTGRVDKAYFLPGGSRVVTLMGDDGTVRIWDVGDDNSWSTADLILATEFLSGKRAEGGRLVPIEPARAQAAWQNVLAKHAPSFRTTEGPASEFYWEQAKNSAQIGDWEMAVHHLSRQLDTPWISRQPRSSGRTEQRLEAP